MISSSVISAKNKGASKVDHAASQPAFNWTQDSTSKLVLMETHGSLEDAPRS